MAIQIYLNDAEVQVLQVALLEYEVVIDKYKHSRPLLSVADNRRIRSILSIIETIHRKYEDAPKIKKVKGDPQPPTDLITSPELEKLINSDATSTQT